MHRMNSHSGHTSRMDTDDVSNTSQSMFDNQEEANKEIAKRDKEEQEKIKKEIEQNIENSINKYNNALTNTLKTIMNGGGDE